MDCFGVNFKSMIQTKSKVETSFPLEIQEMHGEELGNHVKSFFSLIFLHVKKKLILSMLFLLCFKRNLLILIIKK